MSETTANAGATIDTPYVGPVQGKERYSSIDVVRGVALFGILLMNIIVFGHGMGVEEFMTPGGAQGANFWVWFVENTFFEGTQRTLFSLLFGAGVIILTSRAEKRGAGLMTADIFSRRNLWLIAFGMVDSYLLLWDGDILFFYGLVALFLFPLRHVRPRNLILTGLVGMAVLSGQRLYEASELHQDHTDYQAAAEIKHAGGELDEEQQEAFDGWPKILKESSFNEEERKEHIEEHTGSYWTTFKAHSPFLTKMHGNIMYRWIFLDVFSIMCIGMALMKLGILTLQRSSRFYWMMILFGYGIGLPVSFWESSHMVLNDFSLLSELDWMWTYDIGRLGNGTGHLAVILLFVRSGKAMWLQERLAAVGRMALTNYIMHSVLCGIIFLGVGFGLYGYFERYELYSVVAVICLFQLLISKPWLDRYRFGPLEWAWRSLTYLKKQKMKR